MSNDVEQKLMKTHCFYGRKVPMALIWVTVTFKGDLIEKTI
jgi:hypothetical protein